MNSIDLIGCSWDEFSAEYEKKVLSKFVDKREKYVASQKGFSWVIDEDEKVFSKLTISMKYGLPSHIVGNYQDSNFFLCLLNPSSKVHKNNETISKYKEEEPIDVENAQKKELLECYVKDCNQNIIYKESKSDDQLSYYTNSYFKQVLKEVKEKFEIDIKDLSICNIELFPYRERKFNSIELNKGSNFSDLTTSKFSLALVIRRCLEETPPLFLFRNYRTWRKNLQNYLIYYNSEFSKNLELEDFEENFYAFVSQNGMISKNNIYKVSDMYNSTDMLSKKDLIWLTDDKETLAPLKNEENFYEIVKKITDVPVK